MLMGHSAQRGQLFDAVNLTRFGDLGQAQDRRLGIVWRVVPSVDFWFVFC